MLLGFEIARPEYVLVPHFGRGTIQNEGLMRKRLPLHLVTWSTASERLLP